MAKRVESFTPIPSPSVIPSAVEGSSSAVSVITLTPTPTPIPLRYILIARDGSLTSLSTAVNLSEFLGRDIIVTGVFDATKNVIRVEKREEIEVVE